MTHSLNSKDRVAFGVLKRLANSAEGREFLALLDRIALLHDPAYLPGMTFDQAAYRSGCQRVARTLHDLIALDVDFDKMEADEKRLENEQRKNRENFENEF